MNANSMFRVMETDLHVWMESSGQPASEHQWGKLARAPALPHRFRRKSIQQPAAARAGRPRTLRRGRRNHRLRLMFRDSNVVAEHGFSAVTGSEIARLAGVDPRKFNRARSRAFPRHCGSEYERDAFIYRTVKSCRITGFRAGPARVAWKAAARSAIRVLSAPHPNPRSYAGAVIGTGTRSSERITRQGPATWETQAVVRPRTFFRTGSRHDVQARGGLSQTSRVVNDLSTEIVPPKHARLSNHHIGHSHGRAESRARCASRESSNFVCSRAPVASCESSGL